MTIDVPVRGMVVRDEFDRPRPVAEVAKTFGSQRTVATESLGDFRYVGVIFGDAREDPYRLGNFC